MPPSVFSKGLVLQGRYHLEEPLAVGGMAEVWRGRDAVLQRPVAIKLLHPHLAADAAIAERFRREAISAAKLSHPNIVPTYDAGTENGVSFIVLGLIQGPTLAQVLSRRTVATREATSIARQVALALDHAHSVGLVHRDVKPSNVLLVDDEQRVMVADFGIAKAVDGASDPSLTLPGFVVGTPAYVAPEQAAGSPADARTDVYATGVMLHEMLCRHSAVDQPTSTLVDDQRSLGSHACADLDSAIRPIVERATSTSPAERYQTASEMADAIVEVERSLVNSPPLRDTDAAEQKVVGAPVLIEDTPVPPSRSMPARRRTRRTRWVVVAVVVALVAAAITLGRIVAQLDDGNTSTTTPAAPPTIAAAKSFDPEGDGVENDAASSALVDDRPTTTWSTETYTTRNLGGLKSGVGVVLELQNAAAMSDLLVESPSVDWAASVFVSNAQSRPSSLADWGAPVISRSGIQGNVTFDLPSANGKFVLIWITDLGTANKVTLSEARFANGDN